MAYCDTNILTAFVSEDEVERNFGEEGRKLFPQIGRGKNTKAIHRFNRVKKCVISRDPLLSDIKGHQSSMGAVLTLANIDKVEIKEVDGYERGREVFNRMCSVNDKKLKYFKRKFCSNGKLSGSLNQNKINDIKHLGSALELGEKEFVTYDRRDFKPMNKYIREVEII